MSKLSPSGSGSATAIGNPHDLPPPVPQIPSPLSRHKQPFFRKMLYVMGEFRHLTAQDELQNTCVICFFLIH